MSLFTVPSVAPLNWRDLLSAASIPFTISNARVKFSSRAASGWPHFVNHIQNDPSTLHPNDL